MIYRERGSKNHNAMEDFQVFLVLTLLTWAAVSVSGTTPEISTTTGDTANIPCVFEEGTLRNIYWYYYYKDDTGPQKILFFVKGDITRGPEYADRASLQNDNSTLILKDIVVADEGTYRCDVDRQGQTPVPNIKTKLSVFSLRPDTLPVISPCTWADESSSCSIHDNQSFSLTCTLPRVYPVTGNELIWYQDGKSVSSTHDVTQNDDGTNNISRQIQVSETGNLTCNATYLSANGSENTAVSVVAWIKPSADVPYIPGKKMTTGQVVGMTIGIVLLVCISLASIAFFITKQKFSKAQRSAGQTQSEEKSPSSTQRSGHGYHPIPQKINSDSKQDQDEATSSIPSPKQINSTSPATTCPATTPTATTATTTTTPATAALTSSSNSSQIGITTTTTLAPIATTRTEETIAATGAASLPMHASSQAAGMPTISESDINSDRIFDKLATHMPSDKYTALGTRLGIEYNESKNILVQVSNDYQKATRSCLAQWKTKTGGDMARLKNILQEIEVGDLAKYIK